MRLGLEPGDHLVTVLPNRWEAATLHWACQIAGIIITPVNWRADSGEIDFFLVDAEAKALVYEARVGARRSSARHWRRALPRIAVDARHAPRTSFAAMAAQAAPDARRAPMRKPGR